MGLGISLDDRNFGGEKQSKGRFVCCEKLSNATFMECFFETLLFRPTIAPMLAVFANLTL